MLADIARSDKKGVTYDDAGQAVMADGHFTWFMPCLLDEPCLDDPVTD